MPCYSPLHAFQSEIDGKVYFGNYTEDFLSYNQLKPIQLPCGKCIGCRLEHSRKWAMRCVYEASLHNENCFLTLTYAPEYLPENGTLVKRDLQLFFKRLRKAYPNVRMRYFACGEYGDQFARPHYHVILFGKSFLKGGDLCLPDPLLNPVVCSSFSSSYWRSLFTSSLKSSNDLEENSPNVKVSKELTSIWQKGNVVVGSVTFLSCAYVARYCLKKINGKDARNHYKGRLPEFVVMSRKPGIGAGWFDKYSKEVYTGDFCIVRGVKCKPPRYFDKLLEKQNEAWYNEIKSKRAEYATKHKDDYTWRRLSVMEEFAKIQQQKVARKFENNS